MCVLFVCSYEAEKAPISECSGSGPGSLCLFRFAEQCRHFPFIPGKGLVTPEKTQSALDSNWARKASDGDSVNILQHFAENLVPCLLSRAWVEQLFKSNLKATLFGVFPKEPVSLPCWCNKNEIHQHNFVLHITYFWQ